MRWPDGFWCPACGGREHSMVTTRDLFQCTACRRQTSPIAGTIFASTKLPLRTWFRAVYHLTQTKQGIRRYDLAAMIPRLCWAGVRTAPMPYQLLNWLRFMRNQENLYATALRVTPSQANIWSSHHGAASGRRRPERPGAGPLPSLASPLPGPPCGAADASSPWAPSSRASPPASRRLARLPGAPAWVGCCRPVAHGSWKGSRARTRPKPAAWTGKRCATECTASTRTGLRACSTYLDATV